MEFIISHVKLGRGEFFVVDEKTAREVIHSLFCLRQELVGKECNLVTRLAEQLAEEWIVTPVSRIAHAICSHEVFEYETGKVPWCDGIIHLCQQPTFFQSYLIRHILLVIAVKLGMALVEALAYDEHDIGAFHVARVNCRLV